MPSYAVLIYDDQKFYIHATPEAWADVVAAHGAFRDKVVELGGSLAGGEALAPAATTITGGTAVTDGPDDGVGVLRPTCRPVLAREVDRDRIVSERTQRGHDQVPVPGASAAAVR